MNKKPFTLLLITIVLTGLIIAAALQFGTAQTGTSINGIISMDTTWTRANSPYTLTGPVSVAQGVTLTIEPGVTVQSPGSGPYTLEVNGTLRAIGTNEDKIQFTKITSITFTAVSKGYDEKTGTGSIIQNAIVNSTPIGLEAPAKIDHNKMNGNKVMYAVVGGSSGVISNNTVTALYGSGIACSGNASVLNNTVSGAPWGGIAIGSGSPLIKGNLVTGCMGYTGVMSQGGIVIVSDGSVSGSVTPIITENTVTGNNLGLTFGVQFDGQPIAPTIINNNIYGNLKYNCYLDDVAFNVSVANNWWGTTDLQALAQTMYDYHSNYNLGYITFAPFLTTADAAAPSTEFNPNPTPTPTPSPTAAPTTSPTVNPTVTSTPTAQPTITPTGTPTSTPTNAPTQTPNPTITPTVAPTASPPSTANSPNLPVTAIVIAVAIICVTAGVLVFFRTRRKT